MTRNQSPTNAESFVSQQRSTNAEKSGSKQLKSRHLDVRMQMLSECPLLVALTTGDDTASSELEDRLTTTNPVADQAGASAIFPRPPSSSFRAVPRFAPLSHCLRFPSFSRSNSRIHSLWRWISPSRLADWFSFLTQVVGSQVGMADLSGIEMPRRQSKRQPARERGQVHPTIL